MTQGAPKARGKFTVLREESVKRMMATEKAVEGQFQQARLVLTLAVGVALVGFLLVAQWRGNATYGNDLVTQSNQDLAVMIQQIAAENDAMRQEALELELRLMQAEAGGRSRSEVLNEAARQLKDLRLMAGLEAATGPGVVVTMSDPDNVVLASDLLAFVNELRASGAEAMAVDGMRLTAASGFSGEPGRLVLDGKRLEAPYVVEAIGDGAALRQAIEMPGGVAASFGTYPGVSVAISEIDDVSVAEAEHRRFELGTPVEE